MAKFFLDLLRHAFAKSIPARRQSAPQPQQSTVMADMMKMPGQEAI